MSGIKPAGWSERYARRQADDERLLQEYARNEGFGRNLKPLRDWVHHVRKDIGANGVITEVGLKPDGEVLAVYYIEPDPDVRGAPDAVPETGLPNIPVATSIDVPEMARRTEAGPATEKRTSSSPGQAQAW